MQSRWVWFLIGLAARSLLLGLVAYAFLAVRSGPGNDRDLSLKPGDGFRQPPAVRGEQMLFHRRKPVEKELPQRPYRVLERGVGILVVIDRAHVLDLGLRYV